MDKYYQNFTEAAADEVLEEFDDVCKSLGIEYYLVLGTCLSFYRNKGYFAHEHDLDVMPNCSDDKFAQLIEALKQRGFAFRGTPAERAWYGHSFKKGIVLDTWREGDAGNPFTRKKVRFFCRSFDTLVHHGRTYKVPGPVEDYLEFRYGKTWRIPLP